MLKKTVILRDVTPITGAGRGKNLGIPTINIDPKAAEGILEEGVYACFVEIEDKRYKGALHYGPRPVFKDTLSLEVHILDEKLESTPQLVTLEIIGCIRDVQDFDSKEALLERIAEDVKITRGMLGP